MAADRLQQYGSWLKNNIDKKGTPEFEKVASAYKQLRLQGESEGMPSERSSSLFRTSPEFTGEQLPTGGPQTFEEQARPIASQYLRGLGGLVAGAATVPETVMGAVGPLQYKGVPLPVDVQPGRTQEAIRYFTGAGPEDKAVNVGKMTGEVLGTAGLGPLLGAGTKGVAGAKALSSLPKTQKVLNALAESFKTGGFSKPDIDNALARFSINVLGGGTTGATTSALLGENAVVGGAVGAAVPVVGQTIGATVSKGREILSAKNQTLLEAAGGDLDKLIGMLKKNEILVPGSMPHVGELTAEAGNPDFARLVAKALEDNPQYKRNTAVNTKIADMMVQNAVARAQQYEAAFGSAKAAEDAIMQGLVPSPADATDEILNQLKAVAGQRMAKAQAAIQATTGRRMAEAEAGQQQQLAGLQAAREQELGATGATQQASLAQLQAQQQQQRAAMLAEQEAARTAALGRREQRVNQLMAEQEQARNALARPIEPPAPPPELGALEQQRAALEAARGRVGAELPKVSQMEAGKPIVERADVLAKEAQENIVNPAYQKAFASHKGKIDMTSFADEAAGEFPLGSLDLSPFPELRSKIKAHEKAVTQYELMVKAGDKDAVPPKLKLSLEEVNDLGKAINFGLRPDSLVSQSNITRGNLKFIKSNLESLIEKNVSPETKQLLDEARQLAKTAKIEKFDQGVAGLMRRETAEGRERLLPEKVATEVLSKEQSAAEFVRSFGKDPDSVDNLRTAIQDLYRRDVVEPKGAYDPEAHNRFMRKYGDKLDILDNAGLGIRDTLEAQASKASKIESEIGEVSGKIEGLNKVQKQQLDMLKQQQSQALESLAKSQKTALGAVKEEEGKLFSQLSREQKATLGATDKQQRQAFAEMSAKQKEDLTGIKQKFAAEEAAVTKKGKAERQFIEQQRKDMAAKAHRKYSSILGYENVEKMRSKMLSNPAKFTEALPYLNDESKRRLASDIVYDVVGKGGNIESSIIGNRSSLTKILDAAYPGQGKQLVDTLVERAKVLNNIRETGKQSILRPTQPSRMESAEIQDIVKNRRGEFTAAQQADVEALMKDANRAKTFEDLAKIGSTDADQAASNILRENTGSTSITFQTLNSVAAFINQTAKRLLFIDDERIRNKIAMAAIDPKLMTEFLEAAKAYQKFGEKAGKAYRATGSAAAKVVPVTTNDNRNNRNALAR